MKSSKAGRLIVGSGEDCADIFYACGFRAPDSFVYFEAGGRKAVAVSSLEYSRAKGQLNKGVELFNRDELLPSGSKGHGMAELLVSMSSRLGVRSWDVPSYFPLSLADSLRSAGVEVRAVEGEYLPRRARKSASEVAAIRSAMEATEESMALVESMLKDSKADSKGFLSLGGRPLTSERAISEIELYLKGRGLSATRTIVACGPCGAEPHNTGSGPLKASQPVIVDIFPRDDRSGYWGDMTRTFVKGRVPGVVRRAYEAVLEARESAKKLVRAGALGSEVHAAAFEILVSRGFKTGSVKGVPCGFIHGLGHGLGLEIHESPRLSPANPKPLEAGNVVTVEPGLYYPDWGGIRLEDVVVVRKGSCECLNKFPTVLEPL